ESLPHGIVGIEAHGRITREDCLGVLAPRIDTVLKAGGKVKLIYVAAPDFAGYADGACFDDAVFGTRHFNAFERIAFVGAEGPYSRAVEALDGLMPAELKRFSRNDFAAARSWIVS